MLGTMKTKVSQLHPDRAPAEQLTLLPNDDVATRFRLSDETRRRGLRHVAEIRQMLADRRDATGTARPRSMPSRRPKAA
jgi:hypothetical protein